MKYWFTNCFGKTIEFSNESVYKLTSIQGLSNNTSSVNEVTSIYQIGATMANAKVESKRLIFNGEYEYTADRRKNIINVFVPGKEGRLFAYDGNEEFYLDVMPTNTPTLSDDDVIQDFQFELYAAYPYWRSVKDKESKFTYYSSFFRFPRSFNSTVPWKISKRVLNVISNVHNEGTIPTGFKVIFRALSDVTSPELLYIDTQEKIKMKEDFILSAGDELILTTYDNKKSVLWKKRGIVENAFRYLHDENTFFQLLPGDNLIRYGADQNYQGLEVLLIYETTVVGV